MQLSGEVEPAEGEGFAARADENTCITIRTSAAGQPPVLFMGVAESVSLSKSSEYALLNLTLRAEASRLNTKKEHRSFQNTGSTYEEVINKALGGKAGLQMNVSDKATGRLIVQYNETAWEFALRMASEFGAPLCANVETQVPQLTVGVPETGNTYQLSDVEYDFGSNGNAYEKMKSNSGNSYMQEDFSGTGISTDQYVMLGGYHYLWGTDTAGTAVLLHPEKRNTPDKHQRGSQDRVHTGFAAQCAGIRKDVPRRSKGCGEGQGTGTSGGHR